MLVCYHSGNERTRAEAACNEPPPSDGSLESSKETALAKSTPFPLPAKDINRFWSKVDSSAGPDACWPWTGRTHYSGYGDLAFRVNGRREVHKAHRIAYTLAAGQSVQGDQSVCHRCDNPRCCNPAHLWVGTHADNMHDRDRKGRHYRGGAHDPVRGVDHPRAKLTEKDVREIRRLYAAGGMGLKALGKQFGITPMTVRAVVTRKSWRHIADQGAGE